jgi:hypothetical protein
MGKMNNLKETISVILEVVDKSKGKLKKSAQDIKGVGTESDKATKKVNKLKRETKELKTSLAGMAKGLALAAAAVAAFYFPVAEAAKFERKMKEVQAISGATKAEFAALTTVAKDMGRQTEFSAQQAGEGLKFLTMAGLTAREAIEALSRQHGHI